MTRPAGEVHLGALPPVGHGVCQDPEWMTRFAIGCEELGLESIVLVEHPLLIEDPDSRYPYSRSGRMPLRYDCAVPDPIDLMAFLAAVTSRLVLSTGVLILPAHHPVTLAKRLATLDRLAKGRLRLCIGVGWLRQELEACGTDASTRGRRTDESIDVLRTLWRDAGPQGATFRGEFFAFEHAHSYPKPWQPAGIPIHVGGHTPASRRRAARRGDGWQPLGLAGAELEAAVGELHDEVRRVGRDPNELEITLSAMSSTIQPEDVEEATALGADRVVLNTTEAGVEDALGQLADAARRLGRAPR